MLSCPSLEPSKSWRDTSLTTTLLRCRILQTWMLLRPIRLPVHDAAVECHGIKVPLSLGPQENLVLHAQYSRTFALSCLLSMWELLSARRVSRSRMSPSRRNPSKPMSLGVFLLAGFLFFFFKMSLVYRWSFCMSDHVRLCISGLTFIEKKMQVLQRSPSPSTPPPRAAPLPVAWSWKSCRKRPMRPKRESVFPNGSVKVLSMYALSHRD